MITLQYRGQAYARHDAAAEQLHYDRSAFEALQRQARPAQELTYRGRSYLAAGHDPVASHGQFCYRGVSYSR